MIIDIGPMVAPLTAHDVIHLRIRPGTSCPLAHEIIRDARERLTISHRLRYAVYQSSKVLRTMLAGHGAHM